MPYHPLHGRGKMNKSIISVVGRDQVGIIAKVCTYLSENGVNILDISQTIVDGYFTMLMVTDTQKSEKSFLQLCDDLEALGKSIGCVIKLQKDEIFTKMQRI